MEKIKKHKYLISFLIVACCWMFFASYLTSPRMGIFNGDVGIFTCIGKMWGQGVNLYSEIFDHKGPILFLLFLIPQKLFGSHVSIFYMQLILMIFCLGALFYYVDKEIGTVSALKISFLILFILSFVLVGGGKSEEISLIFSVIAIGIYYKVMKRNVFEVKRIEAYLLGILFTIVMFIKITNGPSIAAIIIFLGIMIIIKSKDYKKILDYILFGELGFLTVFIPLASYFCYKGSLWDMIYATFLFNLNSYNNGMKGFLLGFLGKNQINLVPSQLMIFQTLFVIIILFPIYAFLKNMLFNKTNKDETLFLGILIVINLISLMSGGFHFLHYLIALIPMLAISLISIETNNKSKSKPLFLFVVYTLILIVQIYISFVFSFNTEEGRAGLNIMTNIIEDIKELDYIIPKNEKDSVLTLGPLEQVYIFSDIKPYHKYFMNQFWWSIFDPHIIEEINNTLIINPPIWVLAIDGAMTNNTTMAILKDKYVIEDKLKELTVYKLQGKNN